MATWRTSSKKDVIITILDTTILLYFLLLCIIITGGFVFTLVGMKIRTHTLQSAALLFVILLILRKILDRKTPLGNCRVMRFLQQASNHPVVLYALTGGYAIGMSVVTLMRHLSYHSQGHDLGIFDQVLWNVLHGNGLYSSILGGRSFFSEHFTPILYLLAPLYWIYADPAVLLVLQSCALAVGAIPIYLIAQKKLESKPFALLFALLYICYQPLRYVNLYDFHPIALTTPLLLFAFLYLDRKQYLLFGVFLTLALLCKEEVTLIVVIFGIYVALNQRNKRFGMLLIVLGVVIFALELKMIIPYYRQGSAYGFMHRYSYLGNNIGEVVRTLIFHPLYVARHVFIPAKLDFIVQVFGPVGFLSLLSPSHFLLTFPTLFQSVLSDFPPQYSIEYQYTAPLIPFVFISAICGLRRLLTIAAHWQERLNVRLNKAQIIHAVSLFLILNTCVFFYGNLPDYRISERHRLADTFIRLIPPIVPVSTQQAYVPHLTHRKHTYLFPKISDAEYIFLDMSSPHKGMISQQGYFEKVAMLLDREFYGVLAHEDNLLLFKKGHSRAQNGDVPRFRKHEEGFSIDGALLPSKTGKVEGNVRRAEQGRDRKDFITYGPYVQLPKGTYRLTMVYSTDNIPIGEVVGEWELGFALQRRLNVVHKGEILSVSEDFGTIVQELTVSEEYHEEPLEFRNRYLGSGDLTIKELTIEKWAQAE